MIERVERDSVVAFRLAAHHLGARLEKQDLLVAAGQCGIQNTPPGSALLAVHARVDGITPETISRAIDDKDIVLTWCMRGAPYCIPARVADLFTTEVLPPTEIARRHFMPGVEQSLDRLGMSLADAVGLVDVSVRQVLSGRRSDIRGIMECTQDALGDDRDADHHYD